MFFEIKQRTLDIIRKTRFGVPAASLGDYLGPWPRARETDPRWERISALQLTYGLRPTVLVEYRREAYMSQLDTYARVSIDTFVAAQAATTWSLEADPARWRFIDHPVRTVTHEPVAVLELKFADQAPQWMHDLVRRLDLVRHAFSKYCYAVSEHSAPRWLDRAPSRAVA